MVTRRRKQEAPIGLDKILTPKEERKFLDYLVSVSGDPGGIQNCLIFDLLLQTGMRVTELCTLKVKNCPAYLGGNVIRVLGKGRKFRDIPVSERLAKNISTYLKNHRPATLPSSVRVSDRRKPVFYSARRKPFDRHQIAYKIKKIGWLAGIEKHLHCHMTRHSFSTNTLFKKRVSLSELQVILGHTQITTTAKYLHTVGLLDCRLGNSLDRFEWTL